MQAEGAEARLQCVLERRPRRVEHLVRDNRRRPLGDQVAVFFDGRPASPAEMETEVAPGYELR